MEKEKFSYATWQFVWPATLILVLAAWARLSRLAKLPFGLAQDEVLNADIVEGIRAGRHAIFFREGFGHEPLFHYFAVPFQLLLGDNWLSIRLPAAVLGMVLIALLMGWLRQAHGPKVALLAGGLVAVSWWPIIFSRIGLRPIMLPVFLIGAAWAWDRKRSWAGGLLIGLSFYTYTAARVFIALPLLILLWEGWLWTRQSPRPRLDQSDVAQTGRMAMAAVAMYLPLQVTLWLDPTLQERVDQLLGPLSALQAGQPGPIVTTILQTLGGFFWTGDPRWTYTVPGIPIFDWLTAVLLVVGVAQLLIAGGRDRRARFALIWFGLGLIPSAVTPQAPSIIRLIGVLPLAFALPAIALKNLLPKLSLKNQNTPIIWAVFAAGLLLISGGRAWQTARTWSQAPQTADKYGAIWAHIAQDIKSNDPPTVIVVDSWVDPIDDDSLRRNLGHSREVRWVQSGPQAAGALIIPHLSAPGEDAPLLYVPEYAVLDPLLVELGGLHDPQRRSETYPSFAVYTLPVASLFETDEAIQFLDILSLVNLTVMSDLEPDEGTPSFTIVTFWEIENEVPVDLAFFIHLIDEDGEILAQHDGLDGFAPSLRPGDVLLQRHPIPLSQINPHQPLRFRLGVYQRNTGEQLPPAGYEQPFLVFGAEGFDDQSRNR